MHMRNGILFFGSGKRGKYWLSIFRNFGIEPDGFIDNNRDLCGKLCEGIMIYSPDQLADLCFEQIYITCNKEQEIFEQLLALGVDEKRIITNTHNIWNHLLFHAAADIVQVNEMERVKDSSNKNLLFDLQNGMVLGGVETWSYELAKTLKKKEYQGMYLTTDVSEPTIVDDTYPVFMMAYKEIREEKKQIEICIRKISENLPCTIICNFPQKIFWSACIAKRMYPDQIKIIAIQHSDDQLYYNAYCVWQEYIDRCMVISSRIKEKLLSFGMERQKIDRLEWNIPCKEKTERVWSKQNISFQIGYAGRVTTTAKRIDLLLTLAEKLKRKSISFQINIAGTGDYSETLQDRIQKEGFQDCMICTGYIDRKDIPDFWRRQDIMVSCSEYEGHSISQSEAMAEGAVPVITDVSGARDDVTDGYNGYVVDVGDIDAIVNRIQELYLDREKLKQMGIRAHDTIYERQKNMDQAVFWDNLIKKVWQE